jgi:hypothetical protein
VLLIGSQIYIRMRGAKSDIKPADENAGASADVRPELAPQRLPVSAAE